MTERHAMFPGREVTIKFSRKRNKRLVGIKVKRNKKDWLTLEINPVYEKDEKEPAGLLFKPHLN